MSERSYAIRYRVGLRDTGELYLHQRKMWASQQAADNRLRQMFNVATSLERDFDEREPCVVAVDAADLQPVAADEYQHAEARMLYWTERCARLRPSAPLPSPEWVNVTADDAADLARVFASWEPMTRDNSALPVLREAIEGRLRVVLTRIVTRLQVATAPADAPRQLTMKSPPCTPHADKL